MLRLSQFRSLPPGRLVPKRVAKMASAIVRLLALLPHQAAADEVFDWNVAGFEALPPAARTPSSSAGLWP